MENLVFDKLENAEKYPNILFCGGVLNSPGYPQLIKESVNTLLQNENTRHIDLSFSSDMIKDNIYSFYKGANFMSKVDNIEECMVSMQDYHENGAQRLCIKFM